jgi:hypothetical protein
LPYQINLTSNNQKENVWIGFLKDSQFHCEASKELTISYSGAIGKASALHVKWVSFTGVNQTSPLADSGATNSATTTATFGRDVTYVNGGMTTVVAGNGGTPAIAALSTAPPFAPGTSTTSNTHTSQTFTTARHTAAGRYAANTAVNWTGTTSNRSATVVVSLQPSVTTPDH